MIGRNPVKPIALLLPIRMVLKGIAAFFPFGLLIATLPLLLTQGNFSSDYPRTAMNPGSGLVLEPKPANQISPETRTLPTEQDVCHPAPLDTDPSDDSTGMALHIETLLRKDNRILFPGPQPSFQAPVLIESPAQSFRDRIALNPRPPLPYPRLYPVFLIGDLPPPLA